MENPINVKDKRLVYYIIPMYCEIPITILVHTANEAIQLQITACLEFTLL